MEKDLRAIIAEYGVKGVYETLQKIMHDDLEALKKIMEKQSVPASSSAPPEKKPVTKATTKAKETPAPPQEEHDEEEQDQSISTLMQKAGKGTQIVIQKMSTSTTEKPSFSTLKEAKAWQKGQEEQQRKRLEEQGVNPQSLLTKENLTQWIEEERKGYSVIAREYVGLSEAHIAAAAKEFGIKSSIGRKPKA